MVTLSKIFLVIIFFFLAAIHFYWGLDGEWGMGNVIPSTNEGHMLFQPGSIATLLIGIIFLMVSLFYLILYLVNNYPELWLVKAVRWIIPSIFMLRAIGEFKYVGFFKTIRQTDFGQLDTWLFSPLCLLIAILGFLILFKD